MNTFMCCAGQIDIKTRATRPQPTVSYDLYYYFQKHLLEDQTSVVYCLILTGDTQQIHDSTMGHRLTCIFRNTEQCQLFEHQGLIIPQKCQMKKALNLIKITALTFSPLLYNRGVGEEHVRDMILIRLERSIPIKVFCSDHHM